MGDTVLVNDVGQDVGHGLYEFYIKGAEYTVFNRMNSHYTIGIL
jgi:hypothetical protein